MILTLLETVEIPKVFQVLEKMTKISNPWTFNPIKLTLIISPLWEHMTTKMRIILRKVTTR